MTQGKKKKKKLGKKAKAKAEAEAEAQREATLLHAKVEAYSFNPYGEPLLQLQANPCSVIRRWRLRRSGRPTRPSWCGGPTSWTITRHDGPNHLGL